MSICWYTHTPIAMQRHTGSVFDSARPQQGSNPKQPLPLVPEYGDPIWMLARDDERVAKPSEPRR